MKMSANAATSQLPGMPPVCVMPIRGSAGRRRAVLAAVGLLLAACGGCVQHAGPEAVKLLGDAQAAYGRSDDQGTIAKASEFLDQNSHTAEADVAYYIRGLAYYRARHLPPAREDLKRAADGARGKDLRVKAVKALGDLALESGDADWAQTLYTQALDEMDLAKPPADEVRYGLGCALQHKGLWWDADAQFDRLLHDFPDRPATRLAGRRIRCRAWAFQIAAFDRQDLAEAESARLAKIGPKTTVRQAVVDGKLKFLVQAGWYDTYAAAGNAGQIRAAAAANAQLVPTR
jgi:tetratricopeptide (TPR) repeat protein